MVLEDEINLNFIISKCIVTGFTSDIPDIMRQKLISNGIHKNAVLRHIVLRDNFIAVTVTFKDNTKSIRKLPLDSAQYIYVINA